MSIPKVGVSVILKRYDKKGNFEVLMGIRKGSHGAGTWAFPGGHLEYMEEFEDCAIREILEETNVDLTGSKFSHIHTTNDLMPNENKHYITIFLEVFIYDSQTQFMNIEPDKCEGWQWVNIVDLKTRYETESHTLFIPVKNYCKTKRLY